MKIFLSYGHDSNAPLIEKIKEYLSKDTNGNFKHEVWIETSEIKAGMDWREKIAKDVLERTFLQMRPKKYAKLRINHMSIVPRSELPSDMKENHHFREI